MSYRDDDDWVGEPPERRHPASAADPGFWPGRQVKSADLLDAYAALSTALVCARGEEQMLVPGRDSRGVPMRIVV